MGARNDALLTQTALASRSAGTADARHAKWWQLCKCWWRWRFWAAPVLILKLKNILIYLIFLDCPRVNLGIPRVNSKIEKIFLFIRFFWTAPVLIWAAPVLILKLKKYSY